jgi:hypothetical protein
MATLVYLFKKAHSKVTESTIELDEVTQVYINDDNVGSFIERVTNNGQFDGYVIPHEYLGEIIFSEEITNNVSLLLEYPPEPIDWDFIEKHLPNYSSSDAVCDSNDLATYISGEMYSLAEAIADGNADEGDDADDYDDGNIADIENGCPEYFTLKEWAIHQQHEIDVDLFNDATDAMLGN